MFYILCFFTFFTLFFQTRQPKNTDWNMKTLKMRHKHNVLQSLSKEKTVALNVRSFRSEFKRTGKAVGVILKAFKIPPPFFWHLHIKQCGSWSNPLLCQSSCSLLWPGSRVKQLVFISVGERQDSVSSPLTLQMCLDQGKLTMCFVFFKTLMWLCHIFSADSHCY